MNAMTLLELRTHIMFRARVRAEQLDPNNSSTAGVTNLNTVINLWKDKMIESQPFNWRTGITTINTNGVFSHDMPGSVQRIRSVWDQGNERSLYFRSISDIREADPGFQTTGDPEYWTMPGSTTDISQIGFWPIGTITAHIEYDKTFRDMTDDNDSLLMIGIPEAMQGPFQKALIEGVLVDVLDYLGQAERSAGSWQKYKSFLGDLQDIDSQQATVSEVLSNQATPFRANEIGRMPSGYPRTR